MALEIHLLAACWAVIIGGIQLMRPKGSQSHRWLGWSWMIAMLLVAFSSFAFKSNFDWIMGYGPIHLLSIWTLICIIVSISAIKKGNVKIHKAYLMGAYFGTLGAGITAIAIPGRLLNQLIF